MTPVSRLSAELLETVWRNVIEQISKVGFDVAVTMTDGHSSNMKFFKTKLLKDLPEGIYSVPNPWMLGCFIFLLFDTVHLFKNVYNN